jgi:YHS domain-containing protein
MVMTHKTNLLSLLALAGALLWQPTTARAFQDHKPGTQAEKPKSGAPAIDKAKAGFTGDPYLLDTDPVTREKLGPPEKLVILQHEGRELRFANEQNAKAFQADPQKHVANLDAALVRQQLPFYPLQTCVVSGEKLDSKGNPVDFVYKNRFVRVCCEEHKSKFIADPAKFMATLDQAVVTAQKPKYASTMCFVSEEKLGGMGEPVDYVVGNRLLRMCCDGCEKQIKKDPLKYLAMLDKASSQDQSGKKPGHEHGKDGHDHDHDGQR